MIRSQQHRAIFSSIYLRARAYKRFDVGSHKLAATLKFDCPYRWSVDFHSLFTRANFLAGATNALLSISSHRSQAGVDVVAAMVRTDTGWLGNSRFEKSSSWTMRLALMDGMRLCFNMFLCVFCGYITHTLITVLNVSFPYTSPQQIRALQLAAKTA